MPPRPQFPHLALVFQGQHRPRLHGGGEPDPRVEGNRANRVGHAQALRTRISSIRADWQQEQGRRAQAGLPVIGDRTVFLLKLPDEHNLTYLTKTFGLELIAEYEDGLVLAGTPNLDVVEMERALQQFEISARGGASCAKVLDIFGPNDPHRLEKVLSPALLARWPVEDAETLTLDIWVEVPGNPGYQRRQRARRRGGETEAEFTARRDAVIAATRNQQQMAWDDGRDARIAQLESFITGNGGQVVGQIEDVPEDDNGVVTFPTVCSFVSPCQAEDFVTLF